MGKGTDFDSSSPTEDEMRRAFIELDVKAKSLGGIDKLFLEDQIIYVEYGLKTGFLSEKLADEIAQRLGLNK